MQNQTESTRKSLGEKLEAMITALPAGAITLYEILDFFEDDGLLLLSIFLALIFLVPISIPGVSTVFGTAILLIGIRRLFHLHVWLPKRIAERTIPTEKLVIGLNKALVWFHRLEKLSRPHRLPWFTTHPYTNWINKFAFIFAAGSLMAPFGFLPFSNTLPALALIFFSIGEIEKDGVSIMVGYLANLATLLYFTFLIAGGGYTIIEGLRLLP
jgi:hypothetical protein